MISGVFYPVNTAVTIYLAAGDVYQIGRKGLRLSTSNRRQSDCKSHRKQQSPHRDFGMRFLTTVSQVSYSNVNRAGVSSNFLQHAQNALTLVPSR